MALAIYVCLSIGYSDADGLNRLTIILYLRPRYSATGVTLPRIMAKSNRNGQIGIKAVLRICS